jgi:hypothetical protein
MGFRSIPLGQYPKGIVSRRETFRVAGLVGAAQEALTKKEELSWKELTGLVKGLIVISCCQAVRVGKPVE